MASTDLKRKRADAADEQADDPASKLLFVEAQRKALYTNMYNYRRRIAGLERRESDLVRKNSDMYSVLKLVQAAMLRVSEEGKKLGNLRTEFRKRLDDLPHGMALKACFTL